MEPKLAALLFFALTVVVGLFQLALAAGLPWGAAAMGGRYPGRFPSPLRIAAAINAAVILFIGSIVLAKAGFILPAWSAVAGYAIWGAVLFSLVATVLNLITPSRIERAIWAPVSVLLLGTSVWVALN